MITFEHKMRFSMAFRTALRTALRTAFRMAPRTALILLCFILMLPVSAMAQLSLDNTKAFAAIYEPELGDIYPCTENTAWDIGFCANVLKNPVSAPRILLPKVSQISKAKGLIVLQHGLSDTPYFVRSIADQLQRKGFVVIMPLTPGHGKKVATADMKDDLLLQRWYAHVEQVMHFARGFDLPTFVGGFSTGGTLSTHYALQNVDDVKGVLLFSGALALPSAAETLSKMWGIKPLSKWLDGDYETMGVHPYKYPSVASFSALALMDAINDVRSLLQESENENKRIRLPIFAAHSLADAITPFEGIEKLTNALDGEHLIFKIDESYDLCHADLPMSQVQLIGLRFDKTKVNQSERCAVPLHNPLHAQMMMMLEGFLENHTAKLNTPNPTR